MLHLERSFHLEKTQKKITNILNDKKVNIFTIELRDQQGRFIQLNDSNFDLSFLLEIYEKNVIVTENRRGSVHDNAPPLPITLDTPVIPDFPDDPPDLDEILNQASETILPPTPPILPPLQPLSPPMQLPPTQQRPRPIPIPIKPLDYSSHELADVLLKAQYLKLKNLI